MKLSILTWNTRRATRTSDAWKIIQNSCSDILILQEVSSVPDFILADYSCVERKSRTKGGHEQSFSNMILSRHHVLQEYRLTSSTDWVQNELDFFNGNILSGEILFENGTSIRIISVYSPAWPIPRHRLEGIDISGIKLTLNDNLFCTELLWATLREELMDISRNWIIAGDFNSSVTFDYMWKGGPSGNQEIIDRMNQLGLSECLYSYKGSLVPTFKNARGNKVLHQMDHVYVTQGLYKELKNCHILDKENIFEKSISDHLPIITEFNFQ